MNYSQGKFENYTVENNDGEIHSYLIIWKK